MADGNVAQNVADAGTFALGSDLPGNRLGYGAMRITGAGTWGGSSGVAWGSA